LLRPVLVPVLIGAVLTGLLSGCDADRRGEGDPLPAAAVDTTSVPGPGPATPAMAITIDDLPWIGASRPGEAREDALRRMIDALVQRGVPALGFPNCARAGTGAPTLRLWHDAGLEIGNHTAAHLDLNDAPLDAWLRDARSCHEFVQRLTGASRVWFRYPYLHQGPTAERQAAALALLDELDSPIAHVTIDNSDWILAVAYGQAVAARDTARAAAIAHAFVDHILRATTHYQEVARQKVGRDVPHVLLLHANLLVADNIGTLLDRLSGEHGFSFVSVADAQSDPVYTLGDGYTGPDGLSWLYRMEPATPELKAWDDAEARRLRQEWR
jgi:peptidoglycan/xylan/chitin deacetylase (PgdA/CDA1 family)